MSHVEDRSFDAQMQRVLDVTGARTQVELADILGIKQATIANSKRRRSIPDRWLILLLCRLNVNPQWVLTGKGQAYFYTADQGVQDAYTLVRNLPTRLLAEELIRRVDASDAKRGGHNNL